MISFCNLKHVKVKGWNLLLEDESQFVWSCSLTSFASFASSGSSKAKPSPSTCCSLSQSSASSPSITRWQCVIGQLDATRDSWSPPSSYSLFSARSHHCLNTLLCRVRSAHLVQWLVSVSTSTFSRWWLWFCLLC